ncbi:MAG: hypothetical protein ABI867_31390 [Kofleriaceae bacterium]
MLRSSLMVLVLGTIAACGHAPHGKLGVDLVVLPYIPPDVEELSGTAVDEDDDKPADEPKGTEPAPAPAPTPKK